VREHKLNGLHVDVAEVSLSNMRFSSGQPPHKLLLPLDILLNVIQIAAFGLWPLQTIFTGVEPFQAPPNSFNVMRAEVISRCYYLPRSKHTVKATVVKESGLW